jgi:glycerol-3-phosphate dehydrogenase
MACWLSVPLPSIKPNRRLRDWLSVQVSTKSPKPDMPIKVCVFVDEIGQVVEGFYNTKETYLLAQRQGVEMPITEQIYQMLFCGKSAQEVALSLLGRDLK